MPTKAGRESPRISVNKLGEYMVATASRRRRIIHEQRCPPAFQAARYTEAQEAIAAFLVGGGINETILTAAIDRLNVAQPRSEWDEQRLDLCVEALESFLDFPEHDCLDGMQPEFGPADPRKLEIAGVSVSVRPEVVLRGTDRSGSATIGALKIYIGKTNPLTEDSAAYVATTIYQYVTDVLAQGSNPIAKNCAVLDVFFHKCVAAPKSFVRRRRDIEAACQEIARAWPVA